VPGAREVREGGTGKRGWNVRIRPENTWNEGNVRDLYESIMGSVAVVAVPDPTVTTYGDVEFSPVDQDAQALLATESSEPVTQLENHSSPTE
jgi:hypothetical protein